MVEKYFIVSTGLTGTHFFGNALNTFSAITSYQEPSPDMGKEGSRYIRWKNNTFRNGRLRNYFPFYHYYYLKFKWTRKRLMPSSDSKIYVEANCCLTRIIEIVKTAFPEAKIIQVVRDPRTYIRSAIDRGWFLDNALLDDLNPYYTGEMERSEWFQMTPFERASWSWRRQNEMILSHEPELILKFKDIFKNDHTGFKCLLRFIKPKLDLPDFLELFSSKNRPTKFHILPPFPDWKEEWKKQILDSVEDFNKIYQPKINDCMAEYQEAN
ncbi:MAG: hypothetical protein K9L17_13680 [Clostridiales bacterium]|nr:hypothetical protein [Clostridiales bacterium]